jgi:MFS family permease
LASPTQAARHPPRRVVLEPVGAQPRITARMVLNRTVVVSALGYFVDIYDLLLFSIVRVPSLQGLGLSGSQLLDAGVLLLNAQMAGLLVGGILWGVLGDKRGRVTVLFGSIALYSVANIANAFVVDIPSYAALRFIAGVGLAGELGAAITLVSEVMTKEARGYGTAVVSGVGIAGALLAGTVGALFDWRVAFVVGGALGLVLLVTRYKMAESGMFQNVHDVPGVRRGDLGMLVRSRPRLVKYVQCVLIGLPIWFVVGVLITFSPELARELGVLGPINAGAAVMANYAAAALAGFGTGFLSQKLRTRWWVVLAALGTTAVLVFAYVFARGVSVEVFYALCFLLGISTGYWTVFVTIASEQFGTNLRATVTTTVPNFIRGSVVPITLGFQALGREVGLVRSALIVGVACTLIALVSLRGIEETYGKDLDYLET